MFLVYEGKDPVRVVLDTKWLTYHIIGPTLAGNKFVDQLKILPSKSSYKRYELEAFYKDFADFPTVSQLLQSLDVMVTFDDTEFFIPCKVQESTKVETTFKNGRSIYCNDRKSMLSPTVFPTVQARVIKVMGSRENQPIMTRGSMQFLDQAIGLVKGGGEDGRDAINFAVNYKSKDPESCFDDLRKISVIISTTINELSPGTSIRTGIMFIVIFIVIPKYTFYRYLRF